LNPFFFLNANFRVYLGGGVVVFAKIKQQFTMQNDSRQPSKLQTASFLFEMFATILLSIWGCILLMHQCWTINSAICVWVGTAFALHVSAMNWHRCSTYAQWLAHLYGCGFGAIAFGIAGIVILIIGCIQTFDAFQRIDFPDTCNAASSRAYLLLNCIFLIPTIAMWLQFAGFSIFYAVLRDAIHHSWQQQQHQPPLQRAQSISSIRAEVNGNSISAHPSERSVSAHQVREPGEVSMVSTNYPSEVQQPSQVEGVPSPSSLPMIV
jgi:hypothetical protein